MASTAMLAGCGSQAQPQRTASAEPIAVPPPRPAASTPATEAPATTAEAPATTTAAPSPEDPSLTALRDELRSEKMETARAKLAHYRPLCDKDGYPLVGNVIRKSPKPELQPSELCAAVRAKR